jgi:transketolase
MDEATELRAGDDVAVLACGPYPVAFALEAAAELERDGVHARVLDVHTLAPLDEPAVVAAATETSGIVTVEEHCAAGGLFAAVAETTATFAPCRIVPVAAPRALVDVVGSHEALLAEVGIGPAAIAAAARAVLGGGA